MNIDAIPKFSFETRERDLESIQDDVFDLVIIGGGATGAGCARDAALRGMKCLLLEADDFASGTSSGSSKLIHGGIRYLENYEFSLVFEAIQERERLCRLYAPFVRDIDFVFPTYKNKHPSQFLLGLGLTLYDAFSFFRERHRSLSRKATLKEFPLLKDEKLSGCKVYTDSFAEDYRVVIELIKAAYRHGAKCLSRMRVVALEDQGEIKEIKAEDKWRSQVYSFRAKRVLNCSGPFSDQVRGLLNLKPTLHLTQGVHFIVPAEKLPIEKAYVLSDPENHRILFAIPWNSITYLGTTDTSVKTVEEARAHKEDLDYVLSITKRYFHCDLRSADVIQSWAAVRPLIQPSEDQSNSKISREHQLHENPKGVFHVLGGKLTSHRSMAEEAIDEISRSLGRNAKSRTRKYPLQDRIFSHSPTDHIETVYGWHAEKIRDLQNQNSSLSRLMTSSQPHTYAELEFGIQYEMCLNPIDFLRRRSSLYYECPQPSLAKNVAEYLAERFHQNEDWLKTQIAESEKIFQWDQKGYEA